MGYCLPLRGNLFSRQIKKMKYLFAFIILVASTALSAQECKEYYYLKNGEVEMTLYDKKQAENGMLKYVISGVTKAGKATVATFQSEMFSEKGKSMSKSSGSYKCEGGILYVDARVAMPGDQSAQFKDAEVKAVENYIEYPASLSAGQSLKDASFTMDVTREGGVASTVVFEENDRKVVTKESITTPAGTWECWKITYNGYMKVSMAGIGIPFRFQATEWLAPAFGIVKTETLNKNGKLLGSMMITKVQK